MPRSDSIALDPARIEARAAPGTPPASLCIDAGVAHLRLLARDDQGRPQSDLLLPSSADLPAVLRAQGLDLALATGRLSLLVTGKLATMVCAKLQTGKTLLPAAASWLTARDLLLAEADPRVRTLATIELSASGYAIVGVERGGGLRHHLLAVNTRCGAGSGVNLDRVLEKLALSRDDVDRLLAPSSGDVGRELRKAIPVRTDRCGVFSASATISDKNQGIPVDVALATTLKSEVLKACRKLPPGFDRVWLTGRVFRWRFAQDCARDYLAELGVVEIACDPDNNRLQEALFRFVDRVSHARIAQPDRRLLRPVADSGYPAFAVLKARYEANLRYLRLSPVPTHSTMLAAIADRTLDIGLDVGSTMAKIVLADAVSGEIVHHAAHSNAGDTIATLKRAFDELVRAGLAVIRLRGIGITGSARLQVSQVLEHLYPELAGRITVLVENYAHARGSIDFARAHIARLRANGVAQVNADFCVLVDVGGEDTKISTIALAEAELFGNAMNLKCSAGTGSLMDTLTSMFRLPGIAAASAEAYSAACAPSINATCAVFLMENARKLQLQGVPRAEILAAANWAVVENMARSLWTQLELPEHAVVLLHGQTMCSDPLPLAVTHRLQTFTDAPPYALVPPLPGHRACIGLIRTLATLSPPGAVALPLSRFLDLRLDKRVVECRGAACDDPAARCHRTLLTRRDAQGDRALAFTLGGCSAINELFARSKNRHRPPPVRDTYRALWDFFDARLPRSERPDRLVIPRSFVVSEWAFLLARTLEALGVPVHVDNVREADLAAALPLFNVDSCAPQMGAVGQYRRIAAEPHGMILGVQIEKLPTLGRSQGSACTVNQGGIAVAVSLARTAHPSARFHLLHLDLSRLDVEALFEQLSTRLAPVLQRYRCDLAPARLRHALAEALAAHGALRREAADYAAQLATEALDAGIPVALVVGREYVLNPGIFDSHLRQLLRDKGMAVLPSYVLDLELDSSFGYIYWRNPHFIVTLLDAVARRELHQRLAHPGLAEVFRRIETGPALLPVLQISTFGCGPDSIVQPLIAEIMKGRPFLLIQSDAVLKELAHIENRVNTYVKQLELGLSQRLRIGDGEPFDVLTLAELRQTGPLDRDTDVIYFPTFSDNRPMTAVLRAAGYTCIDNYSDDFDLHRLIREGRKATGDAVCAPLAGTYADLLRAIDDYAARQRRRDPLLAGKRRLVFFEIKGSGPCRQGQYPEVHQLLFQRGDHALPASPAGSGCTVPPGSSTVRFLAAQEADGFNIGMDAWVLARGHQATVLQGVLHALLFSGAGACRDYDEYCRFLADHRALKATICGILETPIRAGEFSRRLDAARWLPGTLKTVLRGLACRFAGRAFARPLREFVGRWPAPGRARPRFRIVLSGEIYMRITQAEDVFRMLLAHLGFGRFELIYTPAWSYLEYLLDESNEVARDRVGRLTAEPGKAPEHAAALQAERRRIRRNEGVRFLLRQVLARPLYHAARLAMPPSTRQVLETAREILPTLRPLGEILTYTGEALSELRHGADLVLNVAPNGCMVSSMGELLTPSIAAAPGVGQAQIQNLFSADGEVDEELLTLALLKAMGPERYCTVAAETA